MTTKKNWRIAKKMVTVVRSIYGKVKKEEEVQVKKHCICRKSHTGRQLHLEHELFLSDTSAVWTM